MSPVLFKQKVMSPQASLTFKQWGELETGELRLHSRFSEILCSLNIFFTTAWNVPKFAGSSCWYSGLVNYHSTHKPFCMPVTIDVKVLLSQVTVVPVICQACNCYAIAQQNNVKWYLNKVTLTTYFYILFQKFWITSGSFSPNILLHSR